jgi:hypothetical protein
MYYCSIDVWCRQDIQIKIVQDPKSSAFRHLKLINLLRACPLVSLMKYFTVNVI